MKKIRYGFTDIKVDANVNINKFVQIYDVDGNLISETEIYFIEEE